MRLFFLLCLLAVVPQALAQPAADPFSNGPASLPNPPPCADPESAPDQARIPCAAIVVFSKGVSVHNRGRILRANGAQSRFHFDNVSASAIVIPDQEVWRRIQRNSDILSIIPDRPVSVLGRIDAAGQGSKPGASAPQVVPDGVQRIGARPGALEQKGAGVGVAVVDTGLDFLHADLTVSPSCFTAYAGCQDDDGHGTHVGGIVAALDNTKDVVGVAPQTTLYAVKVLNQNGRGTDSTIMAGIDWILNNAGRVNPPIRVANVSLGRDGSLNDNPPMRELFRKLHDNLEIAVAVAAGNNAALEVPTQVPATYPEVLAVASTTAVAGSSACGGVSGISADTASYFTTDGRFDASSGIGVTISAPGNSREDIKKSCFLQSSGILSLRLGGGTVRMGGTSMASPHVAGVLALMNEQAGLSLDPETARDRIRSTAFRIGQAPLNSPVRSYTFDGEREGVLSACGVLGAVCP